MQSLDTSNAPDSQRQAAGGPQRNQKAVTAFGVGVLVLLIGGGAAVYFANRNNGGGDSDGNQGSSSSGTTMGPTTPAETTTTSTSTTTPFVYPTSSPCVLGAEAGACESYLNGLYTSFDPSNDESPLGVTIRGQPRYVPEGWFFCTNTCFRGQPDCYVAASLINNRVMVSQTTGAPKMPMDYKVGIIFQPKAIEDRIAKCMWQYDGAAFNRLNGGCGCGIGLPECSDEQKSAFGNVCPETGADASRGDCDSVERCSCDTELTTYPQMCYWKGPAFYSSSTVGVSPNLTIGGPNQLRNALKQRMNDDTGNTLDNKPLKEYWDEVTIDGKVMQELMRQNLSNIIAGIMYTRGDTQSRQWADQYNTWFNTNYQQTVPIVAMDTRNQPTAGAGPFYPVENLEDMVTV